MFSQSSPSSSKRISKVSPRLSPRVKPRSSTHYSFTSFAPTSFLAGFLDHPNKSVEEIQTDEISILPLKVIEYTGGEFSENYSVSNIVSKYDNVYCAKQNHCTVVFSIESRLAMVKEINVVAPPHTGYTSPVQHIAIFLSMTNEGNLINRIDQYLENSNIKHLFTPQAHSDSIYDGEPANSANGHHFLQNWSLFKDELGQLHQDEEDFCVARYHLCHPNYKSDPNNYALILDMGTHQTRLRTVTTTRTSKGALVKSTDEDNGCCEYGTCDNEEDYSLTNTQGVSSESHTIKTRVSETKWKSEGPLEPIALASIPYSSVYRHVRIRFNKPVVGKYLAVKFSNTSVRGLANVDIESFAVRGVVNQGAAITFT